MVNHHILVGIFVAVVAGLMLSGLKPTLDLFLVLIIIGLVLTVGGNLDSDMSVSVSFVAL